MYASEQLLCLVCLRQKGNVYEAGKTGVCVTVQPHSLTPEWLCVCASTDTGAGVFLFSPPGWCWSWCYPSVLQRRNDPMPGCVCLEEWMNTLLLAFPSFLDLHLAFLQLSHLELISRLKSSRIKEWEFIFPLNLFYLQTHTLSLKNISGLPSPNFCPVLLKKCWRALKWEIVLILLNLVWTWPLCILHFKLLQCILKHLLLKKSLDKLRYQAIKAKFCTENPLEYLFFSIFHPRISKYFTNIDYTSAALEASKNWQLFSFFFPSFNRW